MSTKAEEFARTTHHAVEPWMKAGLWDQHVGCLICEQDGPEAPCWGTAICHGYANGCGCVECAKRDAKAPPLKIDELKACQAIVDAAERAKKKKGE